MLDTALAVQLAQAADILLADLDALLAVLKRRAHEHKLTPTIGRSHGIHAEPVTFGLKLAQAYAEFDRNKARLEAARDEIATCAISGAVGTFANIDPAVEEHVAKELGLKPEPASTQVIPRDRHAMFFATLGVIASSIERLATEIRHLQRTEVLEAEEYFAPGQKGSSAMPHKRNPVLTENLTGLARVVRSAVTPALENVALWHERDISHSSVERFIGPDATITLDFALARLTQVVDKLLVYPERMQKNLDRMGGLVHSQRVLLALTQAGISREDAYAIVQRNAMKVWESDGALSLLDLLKADPEVTAHLDAAALEASFDLDYHFKHIDTIFRPGFRRLTRVSSPTRPGVGYAYTRGDGQLSGNGAPPKSSRAASWSCSARIGASPMSPPISATISPTAARVHGRPAAGRVFRRRRRPFAAQPAGADARSAGHRRGCSPCSSPASPSRSTSPCISTPAGSSSRRCPRRASRPATPPARSASSPSALDGCDDRHRYAPARRALLRALTGFDSVTLFRLDAGRARRRGSPRTRAATGPRPPPLPAARLAHPRRCRGARRAALEPDGAARPARARACCAPGRPSGRASGDPGAKRACLAVPLVSAGMPWGVAVCLNRAARQPTLERIAAAELFADMLAMRAELCELRAGARLSRPARP